MIINLHILIHTPYPPQIHPLPNATKLYYKSTTSANDHPQNKNDKIFNGHEMYDEEEANYYRIN